MTDGAHTPPIRARPDQSANSPITPPAQNRRRPNHARNPLPADKLGHLSRRGGAPGILRLEDLGAEIVNPAGEYYEDYYAVFFLDPDGLKLEGMKYGELIGRGVKASRTRRNRAETVPLTPSCQARQTRDRSAGLSSRWPTPGGAGVGPSGGR